MESPEPVEKKCGQLNHFWVSYGPLKYVCKRPKISFSRIPPKILTFDYYSKNKTYSEVNFICVYQVWSKLIEKCPSKKFKMAATKFSFLTFQHQTAVISGASSRSPCFCYYQSRSSPKGALEMAADFPISNPTFPSWFQFLDSHV